MQVPVRLLDSDAAVRDLGEHRLKDLTGAERLYQLGEGDFPPLRTLDTAPLTAVPLAAEAPAEIAGEPVARIVALDTGDGYKFFLGDGSWLLIRASGTEPLVRVYTEATSPDLRDALLVAGEALVRGS